MRNKQSKSLCFNSDGHYQISAVYKNIIGRPPQVGEICKLSHKQGKAVTVRHGNEALLCFVKGRN